MTKTPSMKPIMTPRKSHWPQAATPSFFHHPVPSGHPMSEWQFSTEVQA